MCEPVTPRSWKHEFLDLSARLELFRYKNPSISRVTDLLHGYIEVVESLLLAEVNGGLDELYDDFPDAPSRTGERKVDEPESNPETSGSA